MSPVVRPAALSDIDAIAQIYAHAVQSSVATFDMADPPFGYWQDKLSSVEPGDHIVVVQDGGPVVGYAFTPRRFARARRTPARERRRSTWLRTPLAVAWAG